MRLQALCCWITPGRSGYHIKRIGQTERHRPMQISATPRRIDEPPGETGGRKGSEHQVSLRFRQESTHRFRSYKLWRIITGVAIAYYKLAASLEGVKLSRVFL